MIGLKGKGHLGVGADADITIIDKSRNKAFRGIAAGKIIMYAGHVVGTRGTALIQRAGQNFIKQLGLNIKLFEPADFYKRPPL